MIEISHLHKKFGKQEVLHDVSARFESGQCIALIGPNGCGKTTLIKCILGMVIPDKGQILVDGKSVSSGFEYRRQIGYMPQIGRYPDNMKIGQIISMITNLRKQGSGTDTELLQQFKLESMYSKRMRTLSGGTTQKVSATLAFLFHSSILILDEPTAGLDPLASEVLKNKIIKEKQEGKLILITSHLLSELDDLVTQVVYMQEGTIRFHHNLSELREITGEEKISKAIAHFLKNRTNE